MKKLDRQKLGAKPPRYSFILNPHTNLRFSKCPQCQRQAFARKFPLVVVVQGDTGYNQGLTCKYCASCELIMAHKQDLDTQVNYYCEAYRPELLGNAYLVIGTIERSVWKKGIQTPSTVAESFEQIAPIKKYLELEYRPAGWYRDEP